MRRRPGILDHPMAGSGPDVGANTALIDEINANGGMGQFTPPSIEEQQRDFLRGRDGGEVYDLLSDPDKGLADDERRQWLAVWAKNAAAGDVAEHKPWLRKTRALVDGAADWTFAGAFMPKAKAGLGHVEHKLTGGKRGMPYEAGLAYEREMLRALEDQEPVADGIGAAAGIGASLYSLPTMGAAGGVTKAANTAMMGPFAFVKPVASRLGNMGRYGAAGVATGGTAAAGYSDDTWENYSANAPWSMGFGGAGGLLGGGMSGGTRKAARDLAEESRRLLKE